jgi:hypothetical protein
VSRPCLPAIPRARAPSTRGLYVYRVVAVGKGPIFAGASTEFPIRITR